ncbi:HTH-type transcriptional repressor CytR [Geobacillus sp. BCO2]|nr:HTH-type transcriptional repressor CytR [Geobacillus sp. BCO2]
MLERLRQWDIPVVLFAREELPPGLFDYIGIDNVAGGRMAVEHLLERGHRRIAFIGGSPQSSVWKARRAGYGDALRTAGIEVDDTLLVPSATTRQGGRMAAKRVLQQPNPPTALFCYNDVVAFGAMLGLKEEGIVPGRDIAVVGFDNIQESGLFQPPLTTVAAFPEKIGACAARRLHERMKGDDGEPKRTILHPELVIRQSSGKRE